MKRMTVFVTTLLLVGAVGQVEADPVYDHCRLGCDIHRQSNYAFCQSDSCRTNVNDDWRACLDSYAGDYRALVDRNVVDPPRPPANQRPRAEAVPAHFPKLMGASWLYGGGNGTAVVDQNGKSVTITMTWHAKNAYGQYSLNDSLIEGDSGEFTIVGHWDKVAFAPNPEGQFTVGVTSDNRIELVSVSGRTAAEFGLEGTVLTRNGG